MVTLVSRVWKPADPRVITIDSFVPVPRGTIAAAPSPLSWPTKEPADVLDYQLSIEPALIGNEGDTIASVDLDIEPKSARRFVVEQYRGGWLQYYPLVIRRTGWSDLQCHGKRISREWKSIAAYRSCCQFSPSPRHLFQRMR